MTLDEFKRVRGLTLIDLARLLSLPVSTTHGYLTGARKPEPDRLANIVEPQRAP